VNPGEIIGHYRIVGPLGKGGMGEVFLAEDTRLQRRVALKVLPPIFASDPAYRQRFEREAQAIAALNHPNIVTIHSVEEDGGRLFITMEYVEGKPLSELIPRGGLPLDRILRIGIDVADAMAAAQQRGITHRDLKPANIVVTGDGRAKVLDFGLAKLREAELAAAGDQMTRMTRELTGEGKIIGTVAYMSPEQAEGKAVDPRSDIFSLGVILHEMATGERPFKGDTSVSIISAILKDTPPPITDTNPVLPADLARIVRRCLAKDPSRRYQTAADLRNELEDLKQDTNGSGISSVRPVPAGRRRVAVLPIVIVAVLLIAATIVFALLRGRRAAPEARTFTIDHFTRLTNTGNAYMAALSRDGRYVVHVKEENGQPSLWVRQTATMSDVRVVPPAGVTYDGVAFSPDGDYIYYNTYQGTAPAGTATLYRIPVLGGTPVPIVNDVDSGVTFSPDGRRMAFVRSDQIKGVTFVMVANIDGTAVEGLASLTPPERFQNEDASWSPDGRTIAATGTLGGSSVGVFAIDVATRATTRLGNPWAYVRKGAWMPDGRSLLVDAVDLSGSNSTPQIWSVAYPSGEATHLTNDLNIYSGISVSGDGRMLATVQAEISAGLETSSLDGKTWTAVTPVTTQADGVRGAAVMPDGRVVYVSAAARVPQLWIADADGSNARELTSGAFAASRPAVSKDGRWIYFQANTKSGVAVWRIAPDGSGLEEITHGGDEQSPLVSPDGRTLYIVQTGSGRPTTARVPVEGGKPAPVSNVFFVAFGISRDGARLIGYSWDEKSRRPVFSQLPVAGGAPQPLVGVPLVGIPPGVADAESGFVYFEPGRPSRFMLLPPGTRARPAAPPVDDVIFWWTVSPDGKRLLVSHGRRSSDVVLIASK
jgi:eukaryotic-like serine/threonine-protein kinase